MGLSLILKPSNTWDMRRCQDHVFTMLKPHLAYIYFQIGKSSENVKTESIRSKEYVYAVNNFWDPFGPSLDQVGTMFSLPLLLSILSSLWVHPLRLWYSSFRLYSSILLFLRALVTSFPLILLLFVKFLYNLPSWNFLYRSYLK